jgi:hypothetical protein
MRRGRFVLVSAVLLLLPARVSGQFYDFVQWQNICLPGSVTGCVSVQAQLEYTSNVYGALTYLHLGIANLQGAAPWVPDNGPFWVRSFAMDYITVLQPRTPSQPFNWPFPHVYATGDVQPMMFEAGAFDYDAGSLGAVGFVGGALFCCDVPPNWGGFEPTSGYTCGGTLWNRYEVYGEIAFSDQTTFSFFGGDTHGQVGSCTTGVDCVSVPEPAAWIMMASGLLGLGLIRLRRRGQEWLG